METTDGVPIERNGRLPDSLGNTLGNCKRRSKINLVLGNFNEEFTLLREDTWCRNVRTIVKSLPPNAEIYGNYIVHEILLWNTVNYNTYLL